MPGNDIMSKYIATYEALCPDDQIDRDDPRRGLIMAEMRAIHRAKTDADAVAVVAWWSAWPNQYHLSAVEFVRDARKMMTKGEIGR